MTEQEATVSDAELARLQALGEGVPTNLADVLKMGSEGKNAFDAVGLFLGADDPEIEGQLQRTVFQTVEEITTTGLILNLAKTGFLKCWTKGGPNTTSNDGKWELPELKDTLLWILRGRPSLNGLSRDQGVQALQGIKIKLNAEPKPLSSV